MANEAILDHAFAPVTRAIDEAAGFGPTLRVLDVGCGSGTLLDLATSQGADAVGVDISPGMAEAARQRVPSATLVVADAQTEDLLAAAPGPSFDRVVSRFGVMFFAEPAAAFANIRRATTPDGRLAAAVWRSTGENVVFTHGLGPLLRRVEVPVVAADAPGPTALADADRTRRLLDEAGWGDIELAPLDFTLDYGVDGSDGVEERFATLMAGGAARLATADLRPGMSEDEWEDLLGEIREEIRDAVVDGAVRIPGAAWLVTARA